MKIIMVGSLPPTRGGIADTTHRLCEHLGKNNDVIGVSFKRLYPRFFFSNQRSEKDVKPANYSRKEIVDALNPLNWYAVATWINAQKPDRVFLVWWTTYLFPCYFFIRLFLNKNIRVSAMVHNVFPHGGESA